jgi:chaperone BCS1
MLASFFSPRFLTHIRQKDSLQPNILYPNYVFAGRMLFMTTNHIEKLDPALIRPGRCDVKQLLDNATRDQMRGLFVRFFQDQQENAELFASKLPEGELSMAKLQGFLLEHKR